ncbi:uncharacterized protein LOC125905698 isoform X2 [Epinephelus fuscoguttatus]|uniref:uncharacterized protein LOC125905698 isoform X2 n=1 Tax=Epinephelus fuscoguttatus TaxID=293821 RepID=UPI0020D1C392|nr:uncharacterized protein LOC125905698 isoform X2 [Epinephelus fuscoguttatus]
MAARQRRSSLIEPLNFSDLTTKLMRHAASFISVFDVSEPEMRQIVGEFQKIVDEVTEMQQMTDKVRRAGAVGGGVGLGLMILAAPFTGGASLLAAGGLAAAAAGGGGVAAAVGGGVGGVGGVGLGLMILAAPFTGGASLLAAGGLAAAGGAVVGANVTKIREEKESVRKVEELGKEFMKIVESLKNDLEEIKTTCEELEKRSAEGQAKRSLSDMEAFQRIVGRVSELRRRTGEVLDVTVTVMEIIHNLFMFIVSVFRVTATPEEDQKLRDSIVQSADQCEKVINAFDQMKKELLDIMEETKSSE